MQSQIAQQLLSMMGQGGKLEGSISGAAVDEAISNLEAALSRQADIESAPEDEEQEQEYVNISVRAAPLKALLQHAKRSDTYVMWRPE